MAVLAILMDVPPVMMGNVVFLVKWVEILNQWGVFRAGVICLPENIFPLVFEFMVSTIMTPTFTF